MKQILSLILLLFLFACDKNKDEPKLLSERYTEKEIFDAMIGTWNFNRLGYDADFKKTEEIVDECSKKYRVDFQKDSTLICTIECSGDVDRGWFYVQIGGSFVGDTQVHIELPECGIFLSPTVEQVGGAILHHYTDSTLVFSKVGYDDINGKYTKNLYSEFKRVK